ncbi:LOG family protein, partial [Bacillus paralicheniformis]|uniref:LOG family protein n=1 Tax=Bacillus paralicheniformis TaxID=1648923 RepID=UPI0024BE5B88
GLHEKPVILYNVNGFYNTILKHFKIMLEEDFIRAEQKALFHVATTSKGVLRLLKKHG